MSFSKLENQETLMCFYFQIETTLQNMYSYLQKLAVGLEQVALDQMIYEGLYDEEFNLAEYRLKGVSIIQDIPIKISL